MSNSSKFGRSMHRAAEWNYLSVNWFFVIGFLVYLSFFYPGFMSNDSVNQLLQARSGVYGDWHPPVMAVIWRIVEQVGLKGGFGMLILQSFMIWIGAYLVYKAYLGGGGALSAGIMFLILFFPPLFGIAGTIWKDNMMWGVLFIVIGAAGFLRAENQDKPSSVDMLMFVILVMLLLMAILMRFNAIFAVFPLLLLVFSRLFGCKSLRQVVISIASTLIMVVLLLALAGYINNKATDHKEHAWLSAASFDIVGVIVRVPDHDRRQALYEEIPESFRNAKDADALMPVYDPRYWVMPGRGPEAPLNLNNFEFHSVSDADREQMQGLWLSIVLNYPIEWLKHRFSVSENLIGLTKHELWSPVFMKTNGFDKGFENQYGRNPESTELQEAVEGRMMALQSYFFFRPWFYLVMAFGVVGYSVLKFDDQRLAPLLVASSGIFHEMGLFVFAPSVDYRYSHYLVFSAIVSVLILAFSNAKTHRLSDSL